MNTYCFSVKIHLPFRRTITRRMGQLMHLFGLTLHRLEMQWCHHTLDIDLRPGDICYITGPSGSGKSILLRELYRLAPCCQRIGLEAIPLESDKSLIDCIDGDLFEAVEILGRVGLSDAAAMLQTPVLLSLGQQFRYRLAQAILSEKRFIFADEFMASVESPTASVICRQLRRQANRKKQIFIFAGVGDHFIPDLEPDVVVVKSSYGPSKIIRHNPPGE